MDDELDGDGDRSDALELLDLIDSDIELRHWIAPKGAGRGRFGRDCQDEVCYTKPSKELEPFASEHEGYMGNWGNSRPVVPPRRHCALAARAQLCHPREGLSGLAS